MPRTKTTARRAEWRGARPKQLGAVQRRPIPKKLGAVQRRPTRASPSSSVAEAAVSKRTPEGVRYKLDLKDPGPCLVMNFNKIRADLDRTGLCMANNSNVSLQGVEDVSKTIDDLKTYVNRAYAKEKWKGYDFDGHEIKSISLEDERLGLVLDDEQPDYDPDGEPVFSVYSEDGDFHRACIVTTDPHGTKVDMGDFGHYQLGGASDVGARASGWVFHPGEDCADEGSLYHPSLRQDGED